MDDSLGFSATHRTFSHNGSSFAPYIQEGKEAFEEKTPCNTVCIRLRAALEEDLKWEEGALLAKKANEAKKAIFWEFDFGFDSSKLRLNDPTFFHSFVLAIDHFQNTLWKQFQPSTFGVCLYRGGVDFSSRLFLQREEEEHFWEWIKDLFPEDVQNKDDAWKNSKEGIHFVDLFSASLFAEYLSRLAAHFSAEVLPFCLLDATLLSSRAKLAQLLSKERFEHLHLAVKGARLPMGMLVWEKEMAFLRSEESMLGVCLPQDSASSFEALPLLEEVFLELQKRKISFRIIPERFLTEQWDGLEELIVLPLGTSPQGKRKLQGFCASGGKVVSVGGNLNLSLESSFEEFKMKCVEQK